MIIKLKKDEEEMTVGTNFLVIKTLMEKALVKPK